MWLQLKNYSKYMVIVYCLRIAFYILIIVKSAHCMRVMIACSGRNTVGAIIIILYNIILFGSIGRRLQGKDRA